MSNISLMFIYPIFIAAIVLFVLYAFFHWVLPQFIANTRRESLTDMLIALKAVINLQLDLYEENIFNDKGDISNANFENYYDDITVNIINSISPEFFLKIKGYMTEDAVVSLICRIVKEYLTKKVLAA